MKVSTFTAIAALVCCTNGLVIRRSGCTSDDDCDGEDICKQGTCGPLGSAGDKCASDDECSGVLACVSGVCATDNGGNNGVCTSDDDCDGEDFCGNGKCLPPGKEGDHCESDDWCSGTLACLNQKCGKEPSDVCTKDADCGAGKVCTNGQCISKPPDKCTKDTDCASDQVCNVATGKCESKPPEKCTKDSDCATNFVCETSSGVCKPKIPDNKCTKDSDCATGQFCEVSSGICKPNPNPVCKCDSDCPTGQKCESGVCKTPNSNPTGFAPDAISLYHVNSGSIEYHSPRGLIEKIQGSGADVSTLVTYTYPASTAGKTCSIVLSFKGTSHTITSTDGSSLYVDIFSNLYYATHDTHDWPNGNGRNVHLGRVRVVDGGDSTVDQDYGLKFPCPTGQTLGYELVPTGDKQHIEWTGTEGPVMVVR